MSRQGFSSPVSRHGLLCCDGVLRPGSRPLLGSRDKRARVAGVGLRAEYLIWLEHKCSGIYNFYPLTHKGSHAFHKNRRKGKRNLPLVDRFVKRSKSASWFIRIFKGAAFLKSNHPLQVSTHKQIMNDLVEC